MFERFKSAFNAFFQRKQVAIPSRTGAVRMYQSAKLSRLTAGFGTLTTSADYEMNTSLRILRARSRQLIRDAAFAKRAKIIVQNNVVGSGMGMQAQVKTPKGSLDKIVNDDIEKNWELWTKADSCHTGGLLNFQDIERMAIGQVFEAGEIFIKKHHRAFGNSKIPFALEIIEPERLVDEYQPSSFAGATIRMGIEHDEFRRPIAYWIKKLYPGEYRYTPYETDAIERIPASQIIHLRMIDRWPQTRSEPWMHTVIRKLNDVDGYSEAEIVAARAAACFMGIIETREEYGQVTETGEREVEYEAGMVNKLQPGEKWNSYIPNRPNSNMDPFMRFMLREIAAGAGCSYESLSRDYSQSNYSSSRLSLLDDRDLWRMVQLWFIRNFRAIIHEEWMMQAIIARALPSVSIYDFSADPQKYLAARFLPRGWTWIDPENEVAAYKEAIKCGFTTTTEVIAQTASGRDLEEVLDERSNELKLMGEKNLVFDTDPQFAGGKAKTEGLPPEKTVEGGQAKKELPFHLKQVKSQGGIS